MGQPGHLVPLLRRVLPLLTVVLVAAVAYDGWVFYSRWSYARQAERDEKAREAADAKKVIDMLGGDKLKILNFYPTPGAIHPGDHASLCYGVNGAQSVSIEPPVAELHPALSYCLQVSPTKDTNYKLIAKDSQGHSETSTVTIQVLH